MNLNMMKYFTINIILVSIICCSDKSINSEIKNNSIFGSYNYSIEDSTKLINRFLSINLILFKDYTFEENNENIQCYANLPDYAGTFEIKDSTLICHQNSYLSVYKDTNQFGKRPTLDFIDLQTSKIEYLIKGDSLINLSNKSIRLCKYKTED